MNLELKNPHSILAALKSRPQDVRELRFRSRNPGGAWDEVLQTAEQAGVPLVLEKKSGGGRGRKQNSRRETERETGSLALVREKPLVTLDEILPAVDSEPKRGIWLALDCLQDTQNVGAILRSAAFFGVRGVLVTKDRSAPLNATVYDISAGGMEVLPICAVTNLSRALDEAKGRGLWVLGTSEHADRTVAQVDRERPWLVVIGNEQKGLRRLSAEKCDELCRLDPQGEVTSLNASVAAGVFLAILTTP